MYLKRKSFINASLPLQQPYRFENIYGVAVASDFAAKMTYLRVNK
jgi:hypothetical protein